MSYDKESILVTGGAGFIGGNFVQRALRSGANRVINLDALTYAGSLLTLSPVIDDEDHIFVEGSIENRELTARLLKEFKPSLVVNFAAESHVDRSIDSPQDFLKTNVVGTFELLEAVRNYWEKLESSEREAFRFLHVSTDEVYGSLGEEGLFSEESPYAPNSPYSASKASSDHFVRAYYHTYGLPVLITNCSNNYGPYQLPEKLIPATIRNALAGRRLSVYGDGGNVRDWLYVEDHCEAVSTVLKKGDPGEVYNVGGHSEKTNLEVVRAICDLLDRLQPESSNAPHRDLITFVEDRPGHDRRYAIDATKIRRDLGWRPTETFESGLEKTVRWYMENAEWCESVLPSESVGSGRLGLGGLQ